MKKIFLTLFSILSISMYAQEEATESSSSGPQAGDISIGLDMVPLLRIIGDNETGGAYNNQQMIIGKYFLYSDLAVRAKLQVGISSISRSTLVDDDANTDPLNRTQLEDVRTTNEGNFGLAIGAEKRINYGKLNVFYGTELVGTYGYNKAKYESANEMNSLNQTPTSAFNTGTGSAGARVTSRNNGTSWGLGGNLLVGFEYYFTDRLAVGSELAWGYLYTKTGVRSQDNEYYNGGVKEETIVTGADNVTNLAGFTNPYASLYLMFRL